MGKEKQENVGDEDMKDVIFSAVYDQSYTSILMSHDWS